MYWLWKWLESYNNCNFSTGKDKCLFNLLFWFPNSFCTFHDYGRGGTPSLASPDGTSLIFYHSEFWTTCACPEKQILPWTFHCNKIFFIFQKLWATCSCPENRDALEFFMVLNILFTFRIFEQLALALKTEMPWNFSWYRTYFLHSGYLSNLRLPWKQRCPGIFHGIEHTFYIQDIWATCACPEKQNVPWIHCIEYIFSILKNFEQLALALKNRVWSEFTVLNTYFLSFRILNNLRLPWKREFALNFSSRGGQNLPPPHLVRHCRTTKWPYIANFVFWIVQNYGE